MQQDFTVHLKTPHAKQDLFLASRAKRKIIRAGRRGGKTIGTGILSVRRFLQGQRVLYAGPTAEQLEVFWNEVVTALREPIEAGVFYKNETEHIIELLGTKQRIRAKTAWNADTLRGDYGDLLILDEWQLMCEDAWGRVGAPMLLDNDGDAVFIYTPPSLASRSASKSTDPQHAAKMFKMAVKEMERARAEGRDPRWEAFHFTSHDNPHISAEALAEISKDMTRLAYLQEIEAEDTDEIPGALWKQAMIDAGRVTPEEVPDLETIVIGVDPPGSDKTECGIVAAGCGPAPRGCDNSSGLKHIYILEDRSMLAPTSRAWATTAVNLYYERKADCLLGEQNYGGNMVEGTIRQVESGEGVNYRDANATRGKVVRAQPVAAAYEHKRVHHVGKFERLEEEMCSYVEGNKSPNRMDAMVWCGIRLLEGSGVLGLVEYLKGGYAQKDEEHMDRLVRVQGATTLAKPATADDGRVCPECRSTAVIPIANGERRCNQCGIQWTPKGMKQPEIPYARRSDYLAGGR